MITVQKSQTAGNIQYDVLSRTNLANYLSETTPRRDAAIDIIKNSIIVFPSLLSPKPDTSDTHSEDK